MILSLLQFVTIPVSESPEPPQLVCATCNAEFSAAWDLCQHAQQEHSLSIYKAVKIFFFCTAQLHSPLFRGGGVDLLNYFIIEYPIVLLFYRFMR